LEVWTLLNLNWNWKKKYIFPYIFSPDSCLLSIKGFFNHSSKAFSTSSNVRFWISSNFKLCIEVAIIYLTMCTNECCHDLFIEKKKFFSCHPVIMMMQLFITLHRNKNMFSFEMRNYSAIYLLFINSKKNIKDDNLWKKFVNRLKNWIRMMLEIVWKWIPN